MSLGMAPSEACRAALAPIAEFFPSFSGALVCLSRDGSHGGASHNMGFSYSLSSDLTNGEAIGVPV